MSRSKPKNPWNYEETVASVEATLDSIESGTLPLETVFERFAAAVEQLRQCEDFLRERKEKMEISLEILESGANEDIDF